MVDKGHSIINTEGDAYLEYSDYYDFSKVTTWCQNKILRSGYVSKISQHQWSVISSVLTSC